MLKSTRQLAYKQEPVKVGLGEGILADLQTGKQLARARADATPHPFCWAIQLICSNPAKTGEPEGFPTPVCKQILTRVTDNARGKAITPLLQSINPDRKDKNMSHYQYEPGETFEDIYEKRSERYAGNRLYNLDEQVSSELKSLVQQLAGKVYWLPKVNEDGTSECPFAESLFKTAGGIAEKLVEKLGVAQEYCRDFEDEVARCERNLERIGLDPTEVRRTAEGVSPFKLDRQEQEYMEVLWRRAAFLKVVQDAEDVLGEYREKASRWPLAD